MLLTLNIAMTKTKIIDRLERSANDHNSRSLLLEEITRTTLRGALELRWNKKKSH